MRRCTPNMPSSNFKYGPCLSSLPSTLSQTPKDNTSAVTDALSGARVCDFNQQIKLVPSHLQCDIVCVCRHTLQSLVVAAASTPFNHDGRRYVGVLRVLWIFLVDVHQHLSGLTRAFFEDFRERDDCQRQDIVLSFMVTLR